MGVLITRALLFVVYTQATDFLETPMCTSGHRASCLAGTRKPVGR